MTAAFIKSKTITIGCLVKVAGPRFGKAEDVAVLLGVKSIRIVTQVLQKLQSAFIVEELKMLQGYSDGELIPNEKDQFPNLLLSLNVGDCTGFFFNLKRWICMKVMGKNCIKLV